MTKQMKRAGAIVCAGMLAAMCAEGETTAAATNAVSDKAAVDIYAIDNPTNALAALRKKWPAAGERVSQWDMPDYAERVSVLSEAQDWCAEDIVNRAEVFERVSRAGIDLKTNPANWYYNLTCALARQGKCDEAFDALEQAVAAGDNEADHARKDEDLTSLRKDVRFTKLLSIMECIDESCWKCAEVVGNEIPLSSNNVYYGFNDKSYRVNLIATNACPIVYLNRFNDHDSVPCEGLLTPRFPKEGEGRNRGYVNFNFRHVFMQKYLQKEFCVPTILASDMTIKSVLPFGEQSAASWLAMSDTTCRNEFRHFLRWNTLGIYSAGEMFGKDGLDRFVANYPGCIAYVGDVDEADKFVRLAADTIRAMPLVRWSDASAMMALTLIRKGQKCVKTEVDFMSGKAWRPALKFSDIDTNKVLRLAASQPADKPAILLPPRFGKRRIVGDLTMVEDIWSEADYPFKRLVLATSMISQHVFARWGERTGVIEAAATAVSVDKEKECELMWKVLQGDERKVRIVPMNEDRSEVRIEVDYHGAFDVPQADGTTLKSTRVDIGCFSVCEGVASIPAIISVFYSPNETRSYGEDGKLLSIDYTKPQLTNGIARVFPVGDWKDEFHYSTNGVMTGWTRMRRDGDSVITNEFTKDGFVVLTRDKLGRPKDVLKDYRATWIQNCESLPSLQGAFINAYAAESIKDDFRSGRLEDVSRLWEYAYENDRDQAGSLSPKPARPFEYRPELCRRADFSEKTTGFSLPLITQIDSSYSDCFVPLKHQTGLLGSLFGNDLLRADSPLILQERGLKPLATPKKMAFCPYRPSTNDLWKVDNEDSEKRLSRFLAILGDGAYRAVDPKRDDDEIEFLSISLTFQGINAGEKSKAYERLDKAYGRCGKDETRKFVERWDEDIDWDRAYVADAGLDNSLLISQGKVREFALWKIVDAEPSVYLLIDTNYDRYQGRDWSCYRFLTATEGGASQERCYCHSLPSLAIGNTILRAMPQSIALGDEHHAAVNNLAVLIYSEVLNPHQYDENAEETVEMLLQLSADSGNVTAMRNLGIFYENRGEPEKAKRYCEAARLKEAEDAEGKAMD